MTHHLNASALESAPYGCAGALEWGVEVFAGGAVRAFYRVKSGAYDISVTKAEAFSVSFHLCTASS